MFFFVIYIISYSSKVLCCSEKVWLTLCSRSFQAFQLFTLINSYGNNITLCDCCISFSTATFYRIGNITVQPSCSGFLGILGKTIEHTACFTINRCICSVFFSTLIPLIGNISFYLTIF